MTERSAFFRADVPEHPILFEAAGVPFAAASENGHPAMYPTPSEIPAHTGRPVSTAFFAGMVTKSAQCSEWWGQKEAEYNSDPRFFLGDTLGYLEIRYEGSGMEIVPLVFGLTVWNYELFFAPQPEETYLENYGGPYREPFDSDPTAAALLRRCLYLNETEGGGKHARFVLAVALRDRPVEKVVLRSDGHRAVAVSAVSFLYSGEALPEDIRVLDPRIFFNRSYQYDLERLARRLYQFRDDIPAQLPPVEIPGWNGPDVQFTGGRVADLMTNVYRVNLWDMANNKVTADGMPHTSSAGAPSYGHYVGMGTFREGVDSYTAHIWTRDIGRVLMELCRAGMTERIPAALEHLCGFLYDPSARFTHPNWKRIANAHALWEQAPADKKADAERLWRSVSGKENDGHGAIMLAIATAYACGAVDSSWMNAHRAALTDAADWFCWQVAHPEESHFDKVLYSESEAATQEGGTYDLFSNIVAWAALWSFAELSARLGWSELQHACIACADTLLEGCMQVFRFEHPVFGPILVDNTYDCWTYGYKRFALLFLQPDILGSLPEENPVWYALLQNTLRAQKNEYFDPWSGRQMGYGQGYLTQTLALLDEQADFSRAMEATVSFCYHRFDHNYIVPEGVIRHGSGRYWFRNCDLGNAVQQAETVKSIRLALGVDDVGCPGAVRFVPRLPDGVEGFTARRYPIHLRRGAAVQTVPAELRARRIPGGWSLHFTADTPVPVTEVRFGPFPADTERLTVTGADTRVQLTKNASGVWAVLQLRGEAVTQLDLRAQKDEK